MADGNIWILAPDANGTCCGCEARMGPCDPCSVVTGGCCFTIGTVGDPTNPNVWTDLATAQAELADRTYDCLVCGDQGGVTYPHGTVTASVVGGTLNLLGTTTAPDPVAARVDVFRFHAAAGVITIPFTLTCGTPASIDLEVEASLYADDGSLVDSDSKASGSGVVTYSNTLTLTVPDDGFYFIQLIYQVGNYTQPFSGTFAVSSDADISYCTIRAAYMDGSDVKVTFASGCPECVDTCYFTIPSEFLNQDPDTPYASALAAQSAITTFSSDCIAAGVIRGDPGDPNQPLPSFVAGITLDTLNITTGLGTSVADNSRLILSSVTATTTGGIIVGYDLTMTGSSGCGINISVYDANSVLIESFDDDIPTQHLVGSHSFALPSNGVYLIRVAVIGLGSETGNISIAISSNDVMDICSIRAAYTDGPDTKYVYCT